MVLRLGCILKPLQGAFETPDAQVTPIPMKSGYLHLPPPPEIRISGGREGGKDQASVFLFFSFFTNNPEMIPLWGQVWGPPPLVLGPVHIYRSTGDNGNNIKCSSALGEKQLVPVYIFSSREL